MRSSIWPADGPDHDLGIDQAGRPDDLLRHAPLDLAHLVGTRGGGDVEDLVHAPLELFERERPVVQGRGQAEAVLHQGPLAGPVAAVHAADLRDGLVGLVDDDQGVAGKVVHQGRGRLAGGPAGQMPGVVLDPLARPDLVHHLQVEARPLAQALGLQELALSLQIATPLFQLRLDAGEGALPHVLGGDVVVGGIDGDPVQTRQLLARERIDLPERFHLVAEQVHPDGGVVVGREDLHHVPAGPEGPPVEVEVVALVLDLHQLAQHVIPGARPSLLQEEHHPVIHLGRSQAVDARDGGDDDGVAALQEAAGGGVAELVDVVVDQGVFLDVGVGLGDVRLGLVVVVVGDEVLGGVLGEELLELVVQLRRQRLVVGDDQGRALHVGDDVRHGEGLAGPGDPQEDLVPLSAQHALGELGDGPGLVPPGLVVANELESSHGLRRGQVARRGGPGATARRAARGLRSVRLLPGVQGCLAGGPVGAPTGVTTRPARERKSA